MSLRLQCDPSSSAVKKLSVNSNDNDLYSFLSAMPEHLCTILRPSTLVLCHAHGPRTYMYCIYVPSSLTSLSHSLRHSTPTTTGAIHSGPSSQAVIYVYTRWLIRTQHLTCDERRSNFSRAHFVHINGDYLWL